MIVTKPEFDWVGRKVTQVISSPDNGGFYHDIEVHFEDGTISRLWTYRDFIGVVTLNSKEEASNIVNISDAK